MNIAKAYLLIIGLTLILASRDNPGTTPPTGDPTTTTTTTTTNPPQTSVPPSEGVSVCLRHLNKDETEPNKLFKMSLSGISLILEYSPPGRYTLHIDGRNTWRSGYDYTTLSFKPHISCFNVRQDIWTGVCLTVDTVKNVVQLFSGPNISFSRKLPNRYVLSGQPVVFPGFDGQVTDVQIWDYRIGYTKIKNYMTGVFGPNRGNALTFSCVCYFFRGSVLEDVYEQQAKHPTSSAKKRRRYPKREKAARECFAVMRMI